MRRDMTPLIVSVVALACCGVAVCVSAAPAAGPAPTSQASAPQVSTNSWELLPPLPIKAAGMHIAPNGDIYLYRPFAGMVRSVDGGKSWTALNDGLDVPNVAIVRMCVNALGEPVFVGRPKADAANNGLSCRYHNGRWKPATGLTASIGAFGITLNSAGELVAVTGWAGEVFVSRDNGDSFTKVATLPEAAALWVVRRRPGTASLYAGGEAGGGVGMVQSLDDGHTWKDFGLTRPSHGGVYAGNLEAIGFNRLGEILVGKQNAKTGTQVARLTGGQWVDSGEGLPLWTKLGADVFVTDAAGQMFLACRSAQGGGGMSISVDDGKTWTAYGAGLPERAAGALALDPGQRLYALCQGGLYRTTHSTVENPTLLINTSAPLPSAVASVPYYLAVTARGGKPPYKFALTGGASPAGLTLSSAGYLTGTSTKTGAAEFTVTVTDTAKATATHALTLTVAARTAGPEDASTRKSTP